MSEIHNRKNSMPDHIATQAKKMAQCKYHQREIDSILVVMIKTIKILTVIKFERLMKERENGSAQQRKVRGSFSKRTKK